MSKKRLALLLGIAVVIIVAASFFISLVPNNEEAEDEETTFDPDPNPETTQITYKDHRREFRQTKKEEDIRDDYQDADASFDDPFIVKDPYDMAPLTAVAKFETDKPSKISVTVEGKDESTSISRTYEGFKKSHDVPIIGLYAGKENTVKLEATTEDEETQSTEITIETDELPDELDKFEVVEANKKKMENGLTFLIPSPGRTKAIDANGDVRWYTSLINRHLFKRLDNGNVLLVTKEGQEGDYDELLEMDMLGKVSNAYKINIGGYDPGNYLHHDIIELPNGNFLATSHEEDSKYKEDHMVEIDRETGRTNRHLNQRDLFPAEAYEEYDEKNADVNDWFHQNAIWFDNDDNSILVSGRSQDVIMKQSYPDSEIQWILGAHEEWPDDYDKYLLDPVGDVKFPGGQHAMKKLPDFDDNPDTIDILLFDNNAVITRGNEDISGDYSRAVHYRINEEEMTVEEIWSYGKERGKSFYSSIVGNTQYLPENDNVLITSGYIEPEDEPDKHYSSVVEVSHDDPAEVIFEWKTEPFSANTDHMIYRAKRMTLYPDEPWSYTSNPAE